MHSPAILDMSASVWKVYW